MTKDYEIGSTYNCGLNLKKKRTSFKDIENVK